MIGRLLPDPKPDGMLWSPEFKRWLSPRQSLIAEGKVLTPEQCEIYRMTWRRAARSIVLPPDVCPRCGRRKVAESAD